MRRGFEKAIEVDAGVSGGHRNGGESGSAGISWSRTPPPIVRPSLWMAIHISAGADFNDMFQAERAVSPFRWVVLERAYSIGAERVGVWRCRKSAHHEI
jgi:hypothetical protein